MSQAAFDYEVSHCKVSRIERAVMANVDAHCPVRMAAVLSVPRKDLVAIDPRFTSRADATRKGFWDVRAKLLHPPRLSASLARSRFGALQKSHHSSAPSGRFAFLPIWRTPHGSRASTVRYSKDCSARSPPSQKRGGVNSPSGPEWRNSKDGGLLCDQVGWPSSWP